MPKIFFGAPIESIHGKLGGSTIRRTRAGHVLSHTVSPAQKKTAAEARVRGHINRVTGDWYGLTDLQRDAWNKYASMLDRPLSGFNVYVRHNCRLLDANHASLTQISNAPFTPETPHFPRAFTATVAETGNTLAWTSPTSGVQWIQVQYSIQVGFSMTGKRRWLLLPAVASNLLTFEHTIALPAAYVIHYRARTINNRGRVTPWTALIPATGAPPPPAPGNTLSLKEHRDPNSGNFVVTFSGGVQLRGHTTTQDGGWILVFFNVDPDYIDGKKLKITWAQTGGGIDLYTKMMLYDGSYDRSSDTDFPDMGAMLLKGAGLLQTISSFGGVMSQRTEEWTVDASGATLDTCCVMIECGSTSIFGALPSLWVYTYQILDQEDNVLLSFVWDTIDMELTGTYWDYGVTEEVF